MLHYTMGYSILNDYKSGQGRENAPVLFGANRTFFKGEPTQFNFISDIYCQPNGVIMSGMLDSVQWMDVNLFRSVLPFKRCMNNSSRYFLHHGSQEMLPISHSRNSSLRSKRNHDVVSFSGGKSLRWTHLYIARYFQPSNPSLVDYLHPGSLISLTRVETAT